MYQSLVILYNSLLIQQVLFTALEKIIFEEHSLKLFKVSKEIFPALGRGESLNGRKGARSKVIDSKAYLDLYAG